MSCLSKGPVKIYWVLSLGFGKNSPEKSLRHLFFSKKRGRPLPMVPAHYP